MTWNTYADYLDSDVWARKRAAAMRRDHWTCQICESSDDLQVHHIRYRWPWGSERLSDLVTLCRDCHEATHAKSRKPEPKPKPPKPPKPRLTWQQKRDNRIKRLIRRLPSVSFTTHDLGTEYHTFTSLLKDLLSRELVTRTGPQPFVYTVTKKGRNFAKKLHKAD